MRLKQLLPLLASAALAACATVTAETHQEIEIATVPEGAHCTLTNGEGRWELDSAPDTVEVVRHFSPLLIQCTASDGTQGSTTLQPQTRNRAYGNILLGGVPAVVDAHTGAAYEYAPASATVTLR